MEVAVLNRARDAMPGGDLVHIDRITQELSVFGIQRTYFDGCRAGSLVPPEELAPYDVMHCYHIGFTWARDCVKSALRSGKPTIVTCICLPTERFLPYKDQRDLLEEVQGVVVYTEREKEHLRKNVGFEGRVHIIPPGVGPEFYGPEIIEGRRGVLAVEARESSKNAWKVKEACEIAGIPCTIATGLNKYDLAGLYRKSLIFVSAAEEEPWGHTILEGLAAGCRCIVSNKVGASLPLREHGLVTFDPSDRDELEKLIKRAAQYADWDYQPNRVARWFSWERSALNLLNVYREVIQWT